ncbi:Ran guanyl-nucleotide exchange factor [Martiniozyma asiatica (nom. inval.)]|nr:Ran guanyl-nucleotide exchange factor [Martiniozyma asiatica]
MAKLSRSTKRSAEPYTTESPLQKKAKRIHSLEAVRAKRYKTLNSAPQAPTEPLDIFVWGSGSMCELGLGPAAKNKEVKRPRLNPLLTKETTDVQFVEFAVGGMHVLALDNEGSLWSWGNNDSAVLGRDASAGEKLKDMKQEGEDSEDDDDGDLNEEESTPQKVPFFDVKDISNELKDRKIVQLAAGDNISAVLLSSGEVYAWGTFRNNEGILGFSPSVKIQKTPFKIDELENIVQLVAGKDHVLALDNKGIPYAWGNGQQFQLARKIMERYTMTSLEPRSFGLKKVKFIGTGEFHAFAITTDGKVFAWGLNQYGQCGITGAKIQDGALVEKPTEIKSLRDKDIVYITGGEHHSMALSASGDVYVFGRYDMKEIGIEKSKLPLDDCIVDDHGNVRSLPVPTKLETVPPCKTVACGSHHSLAVSKSGFVYAWGFADTYAVGLGNLDEDVEKPTRIDNTATRDHDIKLIAAGGQFSVSGGVKLDEAAAEKRVDEIEEFEESL